MCADRLGRGAALLLAAGACVAVPARADVVEGSVTTLLTGRADPRDGTVYTTVPLYQLLRLTLRDVQLPGGDKYLSDVRLEVSAWAGGLLGEPVGGARGTGDLDIAYVEGKLARRHVLVRLGRQGVIGGVARYSHIDGAQVFVNFTPRVGISVYGGVPVIPRFNLTVGEAAAGGRAYYRFSFDSHLAISFAHLQDQGRAARQDLGMDFRARLHERVYLTGSGALSLLERNLPELDLGLTLQPWRELILRLDFRHQTPNQWLPRTSILAVFSDETRTEGGLELDARPHPRVGLRGDYHAIHDPGGFGHRAGARGSLALGPSRQLGLGLDLRLLKLPSKGYYETRIFGHYRILPPLLVTLDLDAYFFDRPVNGQTYSFAGAASLAWDFLPRWRALGSAIVTTTPFVSGGYELVVRLAYNATARFHERSGARRP